MCCLIYLIVKSSAIQQGLIRLQMCDQAYFLEGEDIHSHHIQPKEQGGSDKFSHLVVMSTIGGTHVDLCDNRTND